MFAILLLFSTFSIGGDCVIVGKLQDAKLIGNISETIVSQTQQQCICQMLKSVDSISAVNYFSTTQICQLFSTSSSGLIDLQLSANSLVLYTNQSIIANMFSEFTK
ncbi:hypothetical protein I4U23_015931 [Adineta vaga]|nr:hypothetical protein I4U23_015931 [Adineta vaga]